MTGKIRPTIFRVGCGHDTLPSRPRSARARDEPTGGGAARTGLGRLPCGLDLAGFSLREPTTEKTCGVADNIPVC